ncbi:MAG: ABC transporter substrate-binding protein [Alphaproteobacteria bacterium]|nr:ABC transporter substrate-binding protein [Alphaproteobacteria bacterium]
MKQRLTLLFVATIAGSLGFAGAAAAQLQKVRIATEGAYAPFNFRDADGTLQGFDVDIAKALCAEAKFDCTIVAQDWDGIIPGLLVKKYDAIIASMSITEQRKKSIDFTDKYYQTPARFVARKGSNIEISEAGLKGKTIGVQRATIHAGFIHETYGTIAAIKEYDTQDNANLDLIAGRVDLVLADSVVLLEGFLNKPEGKDFAFVGPIPRGSIVDEGAGIGIRKGDTKLKDAFNAAIKAIRANGTYKKINDKYFSFDVYGPEPQS